MNSLVRLSLPGGPANNGKRTLDAGVAPTALGIVFVAYPGLTPWANVFRASGAGNSCGAHARANGGHKRRAKNDQEVEGFLDYATRRAKNRRGGKNRVPPLGMTGEKAQLNVGAEAPTP